MASPPQRAPAWLLVAAASLGLGCHSILVKRDLSSTPPGQVSYDDLCGLQDYFDAIAVKRGEPPRLVAATDLTGASGDHPTSGTARFGFESEFQRAHLQRLLDANYDRLPPALATARRLELEVYWAEAAGVRRVATDASATLTVDKRSLTLPYHACLSEWLYGEPLYRQRRELLGLPLIGGGAAAP